MFAARDKKKPHYLSDAMCQEVDKILNPREIACLIENTKVFYTLHVFSSRCPSSLLEKHDLWFVKENMNYSGPLSRIHHYSRNYIACSTAPLLLFSSYPHLKSRLEFFPRSVLVKRLTIEKLTE